MRLFTLFAFGMLMTTAVSAQDDCTALFKWLEPQVGLTYTDYNRKGKETGVSTMTVRELQAVPEGTKAVIDVEFADEKMQDYNLEYGMTCAGDKIIIDMSSMLNPAMMQSFGAMETEVEYDGIELPAKLSVGQRLNDGTVTVRSSMGAPGLGMTITVTTENRQVAAQEQVTTPAGTFEAYKITYDQNVKLLGSRRFSVVEWWNNEVGLIKSESYGKNGKLQSSHVLTARQ